MKTVYGVVLLASLLALAHSFPGKTECYSTYIHVCDNHIYECNKWPSTLFLFSRCCNTVGREVSFGVYIYIDEMYIILYDGYERSVTL